MQQEIFYYLRINNIYLISNFGALWNKYSIIDKYFSQHIEQKITIIHGKGRRTKINRAVVQYPSRTDEKNEH